MALALIPQTAFSADLYFHNNGIDEKGALSLDVLVNTLQNEPLNVAGGTLVYNSENFVLGKIELYGSIFDLWAIEPSEQEIGKIEFGGGTTKKGGHIFEGKVLTITFFPIQTGLSEFYFDDAVVLAHDGKGTNILENSGALIYEYRDPDLGSFDTDRDGKVSIHELSVGMST